MHMRNLWRLSGMTALAPEQTAAWQRALGLHIQASGLTTIVMQLHRQRRAYLVSAGCEGCRFRRCELGCHSALLRRAVHQCFPGGDLLPVALPPGLALRSYQCLAVAWPTLAAKPITSTLLEGWGEGRLSLTWRQPGAQVLASLVLATSADGPAPATVLRDAGWAAIALPGAYVRLLMRGPLPPTLPIGRPVSFQPDIFYPME